MRRLLLTAAATVVALNSHAGAERVSLTCEDFVHKTDIESVQWFKGYTYGYMMAKMAKPPLMLETKAIEDAISRVRDLSYRYCLGKPDDPFVNVVAMWADVILSGK
jgi:hypothetical protein